MQKKQILGYALALMATAFWSGNFIVARGLADSLHPFSLSFYRWLVAVLVFTPFAIKYVKRDWAVILSNKTYLLVTATLGVSLFNTLIYFAGHSTIAVNMSLIMLSFPIFILLISAVYLKEKMGINRFVGVFIVLSGVLLIVSKGSFASLLNFEFQPGDPIMFMAAFVFATHSILLKKKPQALSVISLQYITFLLGMLILLPFHIIIGIPNSVTQSSSHVWIGVLYAGLFSSMVSFLSWNKAIEKIGPSTAGMIYYLLPLFSGFLAWIILDEELRIYHLISSVLIIIGILISNGTVRIRR